MEFLLRSKDMTNHADKAKELFEQGYNCAQAVLLAFEDVTGLDTETAAKLSSSFGGGMGRMREVCGAVSGALMVMGIKQGYSDPTATVEKHAHYENIQEFARRYKEENGSIICRELLAGVPKTDGANPEARTAEYYKKRPCGELVWFAAKTLDDMLSE